MVEAGAMRREKCVMSILGKTVRWSWLILGAGVLSACSGSNGKDGARGATGDAGLPGEQGAQGEKGTQGDKGAPGGALSDAALHQAIENVLESRDAGPGPAGTGCDAVHLDPPADGQQFQIATSIPAGQDQEFCQLVLVTQDINLNSSNGLYTAGAHHALVYQTQYKDAIPTTTVGGQTLDGSQMHRCQTPTALWKSTSVIAGGQGTDGQASGAVNKIAFPSNVAVKIKKGDVLLLNFHMINTTDETLNTCYKVNLNSIPSSQVTEEAGFIFWYNPFITVPAGGTSTARMACPITADISLFSAVSHAHVRMDDYSAKLLSGDPEASGTTSVQTLYTNKDWENPVTKVFNPTVSLTKGQWIDYQCHYTNPEQRDVAQGFQTTDEMCMFVGAYWPKQDAHLEFCASDPTKGGEDGRSYGYGTKTGADFLGCFWASKQHYIGGGASDSADRYASDSCITQTCPEASGPIRPYLKCLGDNTDSCTTTCKDAQASFQAVCAMTPASAGGCQEKYGTNGTDGTCAAGAGAQAVAKCSTDAQQTALTAECKTNICASAATGDCTANPTGAACTACIGTFTAANPPTKGGGTNDSCLNSLTFACVADQAKTIGTDCATSCFTDCITSKVTSCVVQDCLNGTSCKAEYDAIATATCP
jgi:hypothetical protein